MNLKKIMSLLTVALTIAIGTVTFGQGAYAAEIPNNTTSTSIAKDSQTKTHKEITNEYLKMKELSKKSVSELKLQGLKDSAIQQVKSNDIKKEYSEHIKKMATYSNDELKKMGYTSKQINAIQNYDGSEQMTVDAASSVTVYTSKSSYEASSSRTDAVIDFSFSWEGQPFMKFTDTLAVCWSEGLYIDRSDSYCKVTYRASADGNQHATSTARVKPEIDGAGTIGARFNFDVMTDFNTVTVVTGGYGQVHLYKKAYVSMFGLRASYVHAELNVKPGISFKGVPSISISSGSEELDYSLQYWEE